MKNTLKSIRGLGAAVLTIGSLAGSANAVTIIDPDGLINGTVLTNAFPGVTITDVAGGVITAQTGLTGTAQFSQNGTTGNFVGLPVTQSPALNLTATLAAASTTNILRFDLTSAANFVSIDLIPNDTDDPGSIHAFDAAGNLVGFQSFAGQNLTGVRNTVSVSGSGIVTVLASGDNQGNNLEIDTFTFNSVPEPSSTLLLGLGAFGFMVRRRRA